MSGRLRPSWESTGPRPNGDLVETPQSAGTNLPGVQGRGVSPRQVHPPQPSAVAPKKSQASKPRRGTVIHGVLPAFVVVGAMRRPDPVHPEGSCQRTGGVSTRTRDVNPWERKPQTSETPSKTLGRRPGLIAGVEIVAGVPPIDPDMPARCRRSQGKRDLPGADGRAGESKKRGRSGGLQDIPRARGGSIRSAPSFGSSIAPLRPLPS